MRITTQHLVDLSMGLSLLLIINAPSIKIFYSSEIINIAGFSGIVLLGIIRILIEKKLSISKATLYSILFGTLLWIVLLLSSIVSRFSLIGLIELLQYLSILIIYIFCCLFVRYEDIKFFLFFQVSWSLIISIMQLNKLISLNEALGQHYLTLGLPIGLGLVTVMGILLHSRKYLFRFILILISLIMLYSLLTLNGRSPITFSITTVFIFWFIRILREKGIRNKIRNIILLSFSTIGVSFILVTQMGEELLNRFLRINTSFESEPRFYLYKYTLEYIIEKPFGYGLNSFWITNLGPYPHNIFLEIAFYSGIIGLMFFIILLVIFVNVVWNSFNIKYINIISMVTTFVFLIWNVSYSLSSSYIVFGTLAITVAIATNKKLILKENI